MAARRKARPTPGKAGGSGKRRTGGVDKAVIERVRGAVENDGRSVVYDRLLTAAGLTEEDPDAIATVISAVESEGMTIIESAPPAPGSRAKARASADSLKIYLQEIGKIPLLTPDEERKTAKQVWDNARKLEKIEAEQGLSIREIIESYRRTSPEEGAKIKLKKIKRKIDRYEKNLREAQRKLIESNLRLVVSIAKRYANKGLPLLDMINEGNLGLMRAVERFDYRKGFKFSTYSSWWIRQAIRRALADQGRTIRVPVHMSDNISRWIKTTRGLSQQFGREPTLGETARAMGISEDKVIEIMKVAQEPSSLEMPVGSGTGSVLSDLIEDSNALSPYKAVLAVAFSEHIQKMLSTLKEKEKTILEMRFGIGGRKRLTLEETGREIGITRERVRQLEVRALEKLRHHRLSEELLAMMIEHES